MCQGKIAGTCQRIYCEALARRKSTICEIGLGLKLFLLHDKQKPSVIPKVEYGCYKHFVQLIKIFFFQKGWVNQTNLMIV